MTTDTQEFDVLVIGAGLSGICAACHLTTESPNKTFAVLERRQAMGGTWDLFRYPGVRSDSDMFTLGYKFRPWTDTKVLADGPSIKQYVTETADEYGVTDKIQFGIKITKASWSTEQANWTLTAIDEATGETRQYRCNFLILCTGYYNYDQGHSPEFAGRDDFAGQILHPQHWPDELDYQDKNVVVIGSGATAVTIVPAMTDKAKRVTMLQRSPTYIAALPSQDHITGFLLKVLPESWVVAITRVRNLGIHYTLYYGSQRWPKFFRKFFLGGVRKALGIKEDDPQMKHFTPRYNPWDERLCAVPDGDLFEAIKADKAAVVTDEIEKFDATGIQLKSGEHLEADIIVTATGLNIQLLGGMEMDVDGETPATKDLLTYKAVMAKDAPNIGIIFGYTNAPWTLKADIAARYLCRLINHMDEKGYRIAIPRTDGDFAIEEESAMDGLKSNYVKRAADKIPRQGTETPWRVLNHYPKDRKMMLKAPIEDGVLKFDAAATG